MLFLPFLFLGYGNSVESVCVFSWAHMRRHDIDTLHQMVCCSISLAIFNDLLDLAILLRQFPTREAPPHLRLPHLVKRAKTTFLPPIPLLEASTLQLFGEGVPVHIMVVIKLGLRQAGAFFFGRYFRDQIEEALAYFLTIIQISTSPRIKWHLVVYEAL